MGLRERKKDATRAALSWAAIRLSVERGFGAVRVEDIAEAAGVSPRTFNNYFSSKGEAVVSRHVDRLHRVGDVLRSRPPDEPLWEAVTQAALAQLQPGPEVDAHPVTDREAWTAGIRTMLAEPALQGEMTRAAARAEADLAAAVAERIGADLAADMYPHLVAAALLAANNVAQAQFLRAGQTGSMERLLREALGRIATGLATP